MVKALQFHRITPNFQFCGTWNTPRQFQRFLEFLCTGSIKVVLPGRDQHGVIITFDDGEENIYDYAFPLLKKYGVRAVVFLIVQHIGKDNLWDLRPTGQRVRHLDWDSIMEMKKYGIEFGSHTMTHQNLTFLSRSELGYEIGESKRILEKRLGECTSISYPFNRVNNTVVNAVARTGYRFGFGGDGTNGLRLKKEGIYITDNMISFGVKISEQPRLLYHYEAIKQKVINYFTLATMLTRKG